MTKPVVKGVSFVLLHLPSMVRYGSKPAREIEKDNTLLARILQGLRSYEEAVEYLPNQVFIGNRQPEELREYRRPWTDTRITSAARYSSWGEILPEEEFYGWLKIADVFNLVSLENKFLQEEVKQRLKIHPLVEKEDLEHLGAGICYDNIEEKITKKGAKPLYINKTQLIGCIEQGHEEDIFHTPQILLENLSNKASGIVALRQVLRASAVPGGAVDYVIGCDEEAVGDRYQRGGGNMGKAVAEHAGCVNASGCDVKAFCCGPEHSVLLAAALVQAGVYENVAIVCGGSLAKLGMKFAGNLKKGMPILEDQIGAISLVIGKDDGKSPVILLDAIGKHEISAGSSAQAIYNSLIIKPLERLGKGILDIDKYAVELHNPDITEPNGNGDVPLGNYRTLAAMAVLRGELKKEEMISFVEKYGMPGFAPTQGHIPSAIPYLGFARERIMKGEIETAMFVGKGSMFLGKMTNLADGISFIIQRNGGISE